MANDDRIYEAYMGEMGETFQEQTRERIDWILEQARHAHKVLDIGCSQGIVSILMAQQGKQVEGVDIQRESIEFAKALVARDYHEIAERAHFNCLDFMEYQTEIDFDAIVITEVLEHLLEPAEFLKKAAEHLNENGRLIVTVPFGVNNHPDHHSTFYLLSALRLISQSFNVQNVYFHPQWMGFSAVLPGDIHPLLTVDESLFEQEEENFHKVHRQMTKRIEVLNTFVQECNKKYSAMSENYAKMKEWQESSRAKAEAATEKNVALTQKLDEREQALRAAQREIDGKNQLLNAAWQETATLTAQVQELCDEIIAEKRDWQQELCFLKELERSVQRLEQQNNYLKQENTTYRKKFSLITDTWYGKLGLKVYHLLKRVKNILRKG